MSNKLEYDVHELQRQLKMSETTSGTQEAKLKALEKQVGIECHDNETTNVRLVNVSRQTQRSEEWKAKHTQVHAKLSFLYGGYTPKAYYWEIVMLMQKLLLTGLLIFIKPGTTSQLAAGFFISGVFFVLHVKTSASQLAAGFFISGV